MKQLNQKITVSAVIEYHPNPNMATIHVDQDIIEDVYIHSVLLKDGSYTGLHGVHGNDCRLNSLSTLAIIECIYRLGNIIGVNLGKRKITIEKKKGQAWDVRPEDVMLRIAEHLGVIARFEEFDTILKWPSKK